MRLADILRMTLAAALCACATQAELLNSDLIRERFGTYGVEVLEQSADTRRSNLYSLEETGRICRTYAVVKFEEVADAEIAAAHNAVIAGHSLGETFRDAGWKLEKRTIHVGNVTIDHDDHRILELMHLAAPRDLALHVYEMHLQQPSKSLHYATILEVHHPDYLSVADLRDRYSLAGNEAATPAQVMSFVALLHSD